MARFDDAVVLVTLIQDFDAIGNPINTQKLDEVLCKVESVTRNEFYQAVAVSNDLKPELTIVVHSYEYDNQQQVIYNGRKYNVWRTFKRSLEETELICIGVAANGTN